MVFACVCVCVCGGGGGGGGGGGIKEDWLFKHVLNQPDIDLTALIGKY